MGNEHTLSRSISITKPKASSKILYSEKLNKSNTLSSQLDDSTNMSGSIILKTPKSSNKSINNKNKNKHLFEWNGHGKTVFLIGSFTDWKTLYHMNLDGENKYKAEIVRKLIYLQELPNGTHFYKYIVDGVEIIDDSKPTMNLAGKGDVNILNIKQTSESINLINFDFQRPPLISNDFNYKQRSDSKELQPVDM